MTDNNVIEPPSICPMTFRDKLDDEGIQARNLIKFSVPMRDKKKSLPLNDTKTFTSISKLDTDSPGTPSVKGVVRPQECGDVITTNNRVPLMIATDQVDMSKSICNKTGDYRARYWGQMMDTLKRTIDEIYSACETDESEVECKEVIMILEHSKKDFYSLIEKMNLFKEIENATTENSSSDHASKPVYIAWDERKISPGKPIMKQVLEQTKRAHSHSGQSSSTMSQTEVPVPVNVLVTDVSGPAVESMCDVSTRLGSESGVCTWADKVKSQPSTHKSDNKENVASKTSEKRDRANSKAAPTAHPAKSSAVTKEFRMPKSEGKDDGDWEIVCRQRPRIPKSGSKNGQTLSDRPTRKSLSTKFMWRTQQAAGRSQYFRRNKSKSENNLTPSGSGTDRPSLCHSDDTQPGVVKAYSSLVMPNYFDCEDTVTKLVERDLQPVLSPSKEAIWNIISKKKSFNSAHRKIKSSSTLSCTEISGASSDKTGSKAARSCSSDKQPKSDFYGQCRDGNSNNTNEVSLNGTDNDTLNTSLDNSNDEFGEDDETITNIRQLNKKLADVENVETELQNELGRAQEEEKACRAQIEREEENASREKIEQEETEVSAAAGDLLSPSVERSPNDGSNRLLAQDDSDDGYDFVLNIHCPPAVSVLQTALVPPECPLSVEEVKGAAVTQVPLDWSQIEDEQDSVNEREDSVAIMRTPGRGVEMHQKLSAPSRRRSINSMQQLEEKQAKAKILRERLLLDRTERVRELTKKVEEVRQHKWELLEEKKEWMEQRLQKAEVKRQQQLDERVKKAHDEEIKGKEIAFIQSLEAAQKQFTITIKHQESEARLHERQEERKKRMEEKAVREVAAETRRKNIETNRQAWLSELQQRWKTRDEELASKAECKERQRRDAMRAKEVEREQKKIVLEQQQKIHIEQLKEKIHKKHEDSERRHHEQLTEISRKAFEMSVAKYSLEEAADAPPIETYVNKKWCNVCNVMIDSDVLLQSHLSGKKHKGSVKELLSGDHIEKDQIRNFNLEHIVDAPDDKTDPRVQAKKERRKVVKKRIKRIKQRMTAQSPEFEKFVEQLHKSIPHTANKQKFAKIVNDMRRYLGIKDSGPWVSSRVSSLEKVLCDLDRSIDTKVGLVDVRLEQHSFLALGGVRILGVVVELIQAQKSENSPILPEKTFKLVFKCIQKLCVANNDVCHYVLYSNCIAHLLDGLQTKLSFFIPDNFPAYLKNLNQTDRELPTNVVVEQILLTLTIVFDNFVISTTSESIYTANYRVSGDNSGRSSSQSNCSSWIDARISENQKIQDIISYVVSTGTIDKLSDYLSQVRGPLKENSATANFVQIILSFLSSLPKILSPTCSRPSVSVTKMQMDSSQRSDPCVGNDDFFRAISDRTQLLSSIEGTEMCGLVCLLYGLLLYQGNSDASSDGLSSMTGKITITGLKLINNFAMLNLPAMQTVLSQEGTSLQLRHILSYLLFYCNEKLNGLFARSSSTSQISDSSKMEPASFSVPDLLHEVILCIGYFCVNNTENQNFVQTGQRPTILQQLCQLPFAYFSQRNLVQCLYPTLISCCYNNKENTAIIELEMTCGLLSAFIDEKMVEVETPEVMSKNACTNYDSRFEFQHRFPIGNWNSGKSYFER